MNERKSFGYVFLSSEPVSREITVCDAGFERCAPSHFFGALRDFYLFHLVASGKGTFTRQGKTETLGTGSAFLIRPGEQHSYCADAADPWYYLWLGFGGSSAKTLTEAATNGRATFDVPEELIRELESLFLSEKNPEVLTFRLTGYVFRLLGTLCASNSPAVRQRPDIVEAAVRFIENNYFRPFDIGWLARELGMSRSHFTTVFTAEMNASPYSYLTRYRISKAKSLLESRRDVTVTEIAYSVGFSSIERFSETFKKHTGVSPLGYRKDKMASLTEKSIT